MSHDNFMFTLYNAPQKFNATQYRILLCIWDNTNYGKKPGAELSVGEIASDANIHPDGIRRELNRLIRAKVVDVVEDYDAISQSPRVLKINTPGLWNKTLQKHYGEDK